MSSNINQEFAERLYEEKGDVGFWYFYKDSVSSHFRTLLENIPNGTGLKMIAEGILYSAAGLLMLILLATSPIWVPLKNLPKCYKAAKAYEDFREKNSEGGTE